MSKHRLCVSVRGAFSCAIALIAFLPHQATAGTPCPEIRFGFSGPVSVVEGQPVATIRVEREIFIQCEFGSVATVDFSTSAGSAQPGVDYQQVSGTLVFPPASSSTQVLTFTVPIIDDDLFESVETVNLRLRNATGDAFLGTPDRGLLNIEDNDTEGSIRFASSSYGVGEADGRATITVERLGSAGAPASIAFEARPGSAKAGSDFRITAGTLSWGAGDGSPRSFEVVILDDNEVEGQETIRLALSSPSGAVLGSPSSATLSIQDNDQPSELGIESGDSQFGIVGASLDEPLTVRVRNRRDEPVQGARILWEVVEGDAELLDGSETITNSEGLARNRVQLGTALGRIVIRARIAGTDSAVIFIVNSGLGLRGLNLGEARQPVADVLEEICTGPDQGGMLETCQALAALPPPDRVKAVQELSPTKVASQGVVTLDSMNAQVGNVLKRLAALRRAEQRSLELLAFDFQGQLIPAEVLASATASDAGEFPLEDLLARAERGGAASADQAEPVEEPAEALGKRLGFFISGILAVGERVDSDRETGFEFDTTGLTLGLDYRFTESFIFGGALSYLSGDTDLAGSGGNLDTEGLNLAAYMLYQGGERWYLEAVGGVGQTDYTSTRVIDFPGRRQVAIAEPEGELLSLALGLGTDAAAGAATWSFFGRLSYLEGEIDRYQERGAPGMQLTVDTQDLESLLGTAGVEFSYAGSMSWGILLPQLRLSYQHEFADDSRLITARFVDDPRAITFAIPTDDPDRDYLTGGFGLSALLARGVSGFVLYEQDFDRDDLDIYVVSAGLRFELR